MNFKYQRTTLSDGLRLITIPMKGIESVTVLVGVGAGSRYETKRTNGISHFLEHMFFKGTKKRPNAFNITSTIDSIGGEMNAHTGKESTSFYIKCGARHLDLALDLLSDILLNSVFNPKEIKKEKGVIIEEVNMREDTPMARVGEIFDSLLYSPTPLGWKIIGEKESIKKIQRDNFLSFMKRFYRPKNMVVVIAGGVAHRVARDTFFAQSRSGFAAPTFVGERRQSAQKDHFATLEKCSFFQTKSQVKIHYKKTEQAHFCLGVRAFERTHPDRYVLDVLATILGGSMSSRLFTEIREKRGLAYYIRTSTERFLETGHLVTQAGVDVGKIGEAIKAILTEYHKMSNVAKRAIANEELERAKEYLKGRLVLALEDSHAVAALYAGSELLENKIRTPEEIIEGIEKVTGEDVVRLSRKILLQKKLNLAIIGPYKKKERFYGTLSRFA